MPAPREEVCARATPRGTARRFEPSPTPPPRTHAHLFQHLCLWFDGGPLVRLARVQCLGDGTAAWALGASNDVVRAGRRDSPTVSFASRSGKVAARRTF